MSYEPGHGMAPAGLAHLEGRVLERAVVPRLWDGLDKLLDVVLAAPELEPVVVQDIGDRVVEEARSVRDDDGRANREAIQRYALSQAMSKWFVGSSRSRMSTLKSIARTTASFIFYPRDRVPMVLQTAPKLTCLS